MGNHSCNNNNSQRQKLEVKLMNYAELGLVQECTRLVDKKRVKINARHPEFGLTALHFASFAGKDTVSRFLLDCGHSYLEETRLGFVDFNSDPKPIIQALVKRGAGVNEKDGVMGFTCLHIAACYGNVKLVQELVPLCDLEVHDHFGKTPLHWACQNNKLQVCLLLLNAGAEVDAVDGLGRTPLHWASAFGNTDICVQLFAHQARVDVLDAKWKTPLDLAKKQGEQEVATLLQDWSLKKILLFFIASKGPAPVLRLPVELIKQLSDLFYL